MRGVKNNIAELTSGLDWLTLSSFSDEIRRSNFLEFTRYILARERETKQDVKELRIGEYQGVQVGEIQAVERQRDNHLMLRFFGDSTGQYAEEAIVNELDCKCTRIDAQILARFKVPANKYGAVLRRRVEANDARLGKKNFTPIDSYTRMKGDSGITVGARTGAIYSRIYDWELKHNKETTQTLWRYEVELKQEAATDFWMRYQNASDQPTLCAEMVATRLKKLGIAETGFEHLKPQPISGTRKKSDDEMKLRYFEKSVIPFILKMVESGNEAGIKELLSRYQIIDENGVFLPQAV